MKKTNSTLAAVVLGLACLPTWAQKTNSKAQNEVTATTIAPGHYATDQGWGWLVIDPRKNRSSGFSVETRSTFAEGCEFGGELTGRTGVAQRDNSSCIISFTPTIKGVALKLEKEEACRELCGLNGSFESEYLRDANPSCMPAAVEETHDGFKRLYDRKNYRGALELLQPVLSNCTAFLDALNLGSIRNDLAITQYKNGQRAECIATLRPYQIDARRGDKAVLQDWGRPDVAEAYLAIIKAARTNLRLCGQK